MKTKKVIVAIIVAFISLGIVSGTFYLRKTYAKIDGRICKTDIKEISPNLQYTKIKEINKCTEIEKMYLTSAYENAISSFTDFKKLSILLLSCSSVNSSDSRKMSTFSNLKELDIYITAIDFEGFNNGNISYLYTLLSEAKSFDSLAKCSSLKSIVIFDSVIDDSIIKSDGRFVMKDSGFLSTFDKITELKIDVDSIEDVLGICEMESLKTFTVSEGTISESDRKLLEEKGITVIEQSDKN